jgi:hypothetical protein
MKLRFYVVIHGGAVMKKNIIYVFVLLITLTFASCGDKSTITFTQSIDVVPGSWQYDFLPEGHINLLKTGETLSSKISFMAPGKIDYYKFKAEKPGKFTMCWVYYELDYWIMMYDSYAVDYSINDKLEIQQIGDKYPIYEIEKYEKLLFEQFSDESHLSLDWALKNYKNITCSATSDYETRTVEVTVHGWNSKNKYDVHKIIYEYLIDFCQELHEVMHDTTINITFADSDATNDSETD